MSKFKVNNKVMIKATGVYGVIKDRIVVRDHVHKFSTVKYVVKVGNDLKDWVMCERNEIEKIHRTPLARENRYIVLDAPNGRKVTVVAIVKPEHVLRTRPDENGYMTPYVRRGRVLDIGYSICSAEDKYDVKYGVKLATHRAKTIPFCHLVSDFGGEFNNETVDALLNVKANYIINNIDKFVLKF